MIMPLILDPLLKLIDKGVESLREGERQKKLFFEEVIQPLENVIRRAVCSSHCNVQANPKMLLSSQKCERDRLLRGGTNPL
jgi:hypothetical protein